MAQTKDQTKDQTKGACMAELWSCSLEHSSFVHIHRAPSLNMNAVYIISISQALITTPEAEDQLSRDFCVDFRVSVFFFKTATTC